MLWPMFVLALSVALLINLHTRLASLETSATLSAAALITAGVDLVHPTGQDQRWCRRRDTFLSEERVKHFPQFQ